MNFKSKLTILFPIIFLLASCDTKSTKQAITYYKNQIAQDSLKYQELIQLASITASDSFDITIRVGGRRNVADCTKWSLDGKMIDGEMADTDSIKGKLNDLMKYRDVTDIVLYQKNYVVLKTDYRTRSFKYYQIFYLIDNSAYSILKEQSYTFFEGENSPEGKKWLYKLFDRWYLNANGK